MKIYVKPNQLIVWLFLKLFSSGECEVFINGGCGGNQNRLSDIDTCRRACSCMTAKYLNLFMHINPLYKPYEKFRSHHC